MKKENKNSEKKVTKKEQTQPKNATKKFCFVYLGILLIVFLILVLIIYKFYPDITTLLFYNIIFLYFFIGLFLFLMLLKRNKNNEKKVTKKEELRPKNIAEHVMVYLYWISLFLTILSFIVLLCLLFLERDSYSNIVWPSLPFIPKALEVFQYSRKLLFLVMLFLIVLLSILYVIAKNKKQPSVRPRFYRNLLITLIIFFWEIAFLGYSIEYVAKPIIYLYPTEQTKVEVMVGKPHNLTHTYPKYQNGWRVVAEPNGDLTDLAGRHYYALYWEGKHLHKTTPKDGFIVKGADTISFLEEKLAQLGLSEREANEFIVYWLPKLESNEYNFIRFKPKAEIDANMPLYITPTPDTVIRVLMEYRAADKSEKPVIQELPPTPQRTGFVAVEWGGTEI